jgi:tRNA 5-methylaminomethyl-2-thiouridine biosynthesis bifunctional protein
VHDKTNSIPWIKPICTPPKLAWVDEIPCSIDYQDGYSGQDDPIAERLAVYVQDFDWIQSEHTAFVISEFGFGLGLNFILTYKRYIEENPENLAVQGIDYLAFEKHPLTLSDLRRALLRYPDLSLFSEELLPQYPPLIAGIHRLVFAGGRVRLTLIFGDALESIAEIPSDFRVNVWYLDGFSPDKNQSAWNLALFQWMKQQSHRGAKVLTYTASGCVRRALQEAGFLVFKQKGFGRKRQRIWAVLESTEPLKKSILNKKPSVLVVGAGMAGAAMARALAERGEKVTVIEQQATIAPQASGSPAAVLFSKFSPYQLPIHAWHEAGFLYAVRSLSRLQNQMPRNQFWHQVGLLQLAIRAQDQIRQTRFLESQHFPDDWAQAVDAHQVKAISGYSSEYSGIFFPFSGWVEPKIWCQALLNHPNIELFCDAQLYDLARESFCCVSGQDLWLAKTSQGAFTATTVILCNAGGTQNLDILSGYPLKAIRGQLDQVLLKPNTQPLKVAVAHEGYVVSSKEKNSDQYDCLFGATYTRLDHLNFLQEERQTNLLTLNKAVPNLASSIIDHNHEAHARFFCQYRFKTPDYLPMVGPIFNQQGLFVVLGLGSRGVSTANLAAEVIASYLKKEPSPVTHDILKAIHPDRFLLAK